MFTIMDDDGNMTMVEEPSPDYAYTYADYLKWKFEERLELFKGKIFKLAAPNIAHQKMVGVLHYTIFDQLKNHKCDVFVAPCDVRLPAKNRKRDDEITTVVQPDLCVVCDQSKIDEKGICGAPDLIIEVLSPGSSKKEVRLKFELYEEAGVREYWLVNPVEHNLIVYVLNNEQKFGVGKMFTDGDLLKSAAVPGLTIKVSDIFKQ